VKSITEEQLDEAIYHGLHRLDDPLEALEALIAERDDDELSVDFWTLERAYLKFDRHLRERR